MEVPWAQFPSCRRDTHTPPHSPSTPARPAPWTLLKREEPSAHRVGKQGLLVSPPAGCPASCPGPSSLRSVPAPSDALPPPPAQKHSESDGPRGASRHRACRCHRFGSPFRFQSPFRGIAFILGMESWALPSGQQGSEHPRPPPPPPQAERALQTPQFPFSLWPPGSPESAESFRCSYGAFLSCPCAMGSNGSPQPSASITWFLS